MLLTVERTAESKSLDKLQVTPNELVTLHFSEDGKEWISYCMSGRMLHKILTEDRESRMLMQGVSPNYKKINGHSYQIDDFEDESDTEG